MCAENKRFFIIITRFRRRHRRRRFPPHRIIVIVCACTSRKTRDRSYQIIIIVPAIIITLLLRYFALFRPSAADVGPSARSPRPTRLRRVFPIPVGGKIFYYYYYFILYSLTLYKMYRTPTLTRPIYIIHRYIYIFFLTKNRLKRRTRQWDIIIIYLQRRKLFACVYVPATKVLVSKFWLTKTR